jgi:predicted amidohydrolase YtcJ
VWSVKLGSHRVVALLLLAGCSSTASTVVPSSAPPTSGQVPTSASPSTTVSSPSTAPPAAVEPATVVLHGGVIHSKGVANATAIAVRGDTVAAIGSDAEIDAYIGPDTKVVDLAGRLVVPGLIDAHVHTVGGAAEGSKCSLGDQQLTPEAIKPVIDACLAESPGDSWFQVVSVNPAGLTLTAAELDGFVSDRPLIMSSADGHVAWVNSAALAAADITAETPDPEGGLIERDASGKPTGKLIDNATGLAAGNLPTLTPSEYADATADALVDFNKLGITALRDPSVNDEIAAIYEALSTDDRLTARVAMSFTLGDMTKSPAELVDSARAFMASHPEVPQRLTVDQVKVFGDGVIEAPTQSAAMLSPYLDADGKPTENSGELYYDPELFKQQVAALNAADISLHVHAVGDRAVRTALDAFEFARTGPNASLADKTFTNQIVHLQVIDPADFARFAENDVIAGFQGYWALRENYTVEALEPFMGPERYKNVYPVKSVVETGAVVAGGSDWSVTTFNPFGAMQRLVTRRDVRDAQPLGAEQSITIEQALDLYTRGSGASLPFAGVGSLSVGGPADLAVLSQNILTIDPYDIEKTVSQLTLVAGEVVWEEK